MYWVYIILSGKTQKYYCGHTDDLDDRMKRHNDGRSKYTKNGIPWELIVTFEFETRPEAVRLEKKIKGRGIKRYLEDIKFGV